MSIKRVLICGFTENMGGMETYVMNIYRHLDRSQLQFDFLKFHDIKLAFTEEIEKLGGEIFFIPMKRENYKEHYQKLRKLFLENNYAGIYYQCNHKLVSLDLFKYAKKNGVSKRVVHSHNSAQEPTSFLHRIREKRVENKFDQYITDCFACSEEAGRMMFGNRNFTVIKNSVDSTVFCMNKSARDKIQKELDIQNKLVIGTVGRLSNAKNPFYILEIFKALHNREPESAFIHIGEGEYRDALETKIREYQLEECYHLMGKKSNVVDYLNAMDIFLLPSKFEGFPFVLIEAQATGLPCVISNTVTKACDLTGKNGYLSIEESPEVWADYLLKLDISTRESETDCIRAKGYDIRQVAKQIQDFFVLA